MSDKNNNNRDNIWKYGLYTNIFCILLHRQNGLGYSSFIARIGVSISPLVMILDDVSSYLSSIIFTLVAFSTTLSALFLPETLNVRLPETIEDIEQTRYSTAPLFSAKLIGECFVKMYFVLQKTINTHIWWEIYSVTVLDLNNKMFHFNWRTILKKITILICETVTLYDH